MLGERQVVRLKNDSFLRSESLLPRSYEAAQPAAEFVAKKFSATLQAYPSLAEYYEWTVSSATDAYANRPSVDAMFDLTRTTITQKAPWMVSQVESHMAKHMKQYEFQKTDKIVLLVILAISVLAILILTKKALVSLHTTKKSQISARDP